MSTRFYCNALFSFFGNTLGFPLLLYPLFFFLRQVRDTLVSSAFTGGQKSSRFIVSRRHPSLQCPFFHSLRERRKKIMQRASTTKRSCQTVLYELRCNQVQKLSVALSGTSPLLRLVVKLPDCNGIPTLCTGD